MKSAVVIPVYKEKLSENELKSFRQCLKILKAHEIFLVTNESVDLFIYNKIAAEECKSFKILNFDVLYFDSINGYNKLMLSKTFYLSFTAFEYILLYQLDAYVFSDELDYWCSLGYDYIGAPLFKFKKGTEYTRKFIGIGNGGLSLRKISYCLKVLHFPKYFPFINPIGLLIGCSELKGVLKFPFKLFGVRNNLHFFQNSGVINEDMVFSIFAKHSWFRATLPNFKLALKFAFEVHPGYLYQLNGERLPFCCHAYEKYEYTTFWNQYIK